MDHIVIATEKAADPDDDVNNPNRVREIAYDRKIIIHHCKDPHCLQAWKQYKRKCICWVTIIVMCNLAMVGVFVYFTR